MTKRQTQISFLSFMILALMFVGMQAFVPVDALAQVEGDGSDTAVLESAGPHYFYPKTPCRIAESRPWFAPWATPYYRGPFSVGTERCYSNYSAATTPGDIQDQGGNLAGCPGTKVANDAGAFHVNIAAVPVWGSGHVRIYPANVGPPNSAVLNWDASVGNISNAVSADNYESTAVDEFCIYIGGPASGGEVYIIMDVMGYFD